ncbi:MAG: hypothetical protein RI894_1226, partial [Bacteroidota bacterium]
MQEAILMLDKIPAVIEFDEDTAVQETDTDKKPFPYDPTKADIDIREEKVSIYEYMRRYKRGLLKINPDYQRNLVWTPYQKIRFIESIVLNFPLPPIYLNQKVDGSFVIIDGLQRTNTLIEFTTGKFALKSLDKLPDLKDKYFGELPNAYQAKIEDKQLFLYILKPSVPISIVYELFDRINTGGTPLNKQEVRNSIFEGKATILLKELAQAERYGFQKATDNGVSAVRMKDQEIILRYLSFRWFDYKKDYTGDMSDFVEKGMQKINDFPDSEIVHLKTDFERVMRLTFEFFGTKNFRLPTTTAPSTANYGRGAINFSLFETVCYFFSTETDDFLIKNKDRITQNFNVLLQDSTFLDAIKTSTNAKSKVISRFDTAKQLLG